jgi:hypothetical protein
MSIRKTPSVILNHVVSPYGIATLSTLIFLFAWVFPGGLYSAIVSEPDLMFLDPQTLLFFLLCVAGFWAGLLLVDFLLPSAQLLESRFRPAPTKGPLLLLPLAVTTLATVLAGVEMFRQSPNLLTLLLSQQGADVKAEFATTQLGVIGWGATMQTVVLWWTYWRLSNVDSTRTDLPKHRRFVWLAFSMGLLAQVALSLLKVSRSDLLPVFAGLAVLYVLKKIQNGELKTAGLIRYCVIFFVAVMSLFVAVGVYRGASDITVALGDFMGYTLASYNRMTALLQGRMHYPFAGRGLYLSLALTTNNSLDSILHLKDAFGWPSYIDIWSSEFQAVEQAGLNSQLIWSGAFGYLFSDFGWGTPLVIGAYGIVYGLVWRQAKSGTAIGVSLYPWFAFSALAWFSSNLVFDSRFFFFLMAAVLLAAYERFLAIHL